MADVTKQDSALPTRESAGIESRFRWRSGGGVGVLAEVLAKYGALAVDGDQWDLYWTGSTPPLDIFRMLDGRRRVSHVLGIGYIVLKHQLATMLVRARELAQARGQSSLFDFAPRSFVFPQQFDDWRAAAASNPDTIWISKTGAGARGEGVTPVQDLVLQEYIRDPHLLDGYKYTLRVFVGVTSLDPLRAWVFPDGLTKLTTRPFTLDRASLGNRFVHLTNSAVLRNDVEVELAGQRMTHIAYRERLRADGIDDARLFRDVHTLVAKTLLAAREPIIQFNTHHGIRLDGQFILLGFDVLVDAKLRPWLIEVNTGPSLKVEAKLETEFGQREHAIKKQVGMDLLTLTGFLPSAPVQFEPIFPSTAMFDWLVAYEYVRDNDLADLKQLVVADAAQALDRAGRTYEPSDSLGSTRERERNDAAILQAALALDPTNPNYAFYFAHCLRGAGEFKEAVVAYRYRASLGGAPDQIYFSLHEIAALSAKTVASHDEVRDAFLRAHEYRPTRAEALCNLAAYLRQAGMGADAYPFARMASAIPRPADALFIDESVYGWRALDEYAIAAYWAGDYAEGLAANQRLLASEMLPSSERERVTTNLAYCNDKVAAVAAE